MSNHLPEASVYPLVEYSEANKLLAEHGLGPVDSQVTVQRTNGDMEDGWYVDVVKVPTDNGTENMAQLTRDDPEGDRLLVKYISLEGLKAWQKAARANVSTSEEQATLNADSGMATPGRKGHDSDTVNAASQEADTGATTNENSTEVEGTIERGSEFDRPNLSEVFASPEAFEQALRNPIWRLICEISSGR